VEVQANEDGSLKDPWGNSLPPFIVMEKGKSLRDKVSELRLDWFTKYQARLHVLL
jgi:hypothetical protein